MNDIALRFDHVWKKFKKGERYDSLRDLIPAMTKKLFRQNNRDDLQEKEFWALKDVSFEVKKGEALGIIGPNGAGKSTILKILSGILRPNKGQMKVNGRLSALIEVGAGFHPDLTGRENVYLNGAILGMTKSEIDKKFDEIVEFSGISEFIDTPVKRYSSGMFARLGFSVAAHVNPDILLVDEVLSVGDWAFQRKCLDKMRSIIQSDATIVLVSHNLKSVSALCNKSLMLRKGEIIILDDTEVVLREYLEQQLTSVTHPRGKVYISEVILGSSNGPRVQFSPGEKAWVDVYIKGKSYADQLAIAIYLTDETHYQIFNTSSERLGHDTFSIRDGETLHFRFELLMHLSRGQFCLGVIVKDYGRNVEFDHLFPAATIIMATDEDVRGGAHLYPKFMSCNNAKHNLSYGVNNRCS